MADRSFADTLTRRILPRTIVSLSQLDGRARVGAALRRRLHRSARVELYFAFDDPCSAVAVLDLAGRLADYEAQLVLYPVVHRGIPDDPAVDLKRVYAIEDARRLLRRSDLTLRRTEPLAPGDVAFLAEWVAGAPQGPALVRFCVDAMRRLWLETDGPVDQTDFEPPSPAALAGDRGSAAVRRDERRMKRRGPYDTPAAWVHGQWFFAHDRLAQIAARLDDLGWRRPA